MPEDRIAILRQQFAEKPPQGLIWCGDPDIPLLVARVTALEDALKFYADPSIYEPEITLATPCGEFSQDHAEPPEVLEDAGETARKALEATP